MNEPAGALPLPRPPPPPGFDRAAFDATLREVDRAAVSVRTLFDGERTTYLRADGIFVLAMASLLFPFSESLGFGWPELWLPSGPFLALGLILTVFPTWWQRAMTRLLPGKWVLPPVETGPPTPDLSRSVRVIGQLWKDWDNLQRFSVLSPFLLAAACFAGSEVVVTIASAILHPGNLEASRVLLLVSTAAVVIPGLIAVAFWTRTRRARIEPLRPVLLSVNARFRQLEWAFWQRY